MMSEPTLRELRVAAFTGGKNVPSARFRVRQYADDLSAAGITLSEYFPASGDAYPPAGVARRIPWIVSQASQRLAQVAAARSSDVTMLQRQMISTVNSLERVTRGPRILDVDDAIWLSAKFRSVDRLASLCDGVICGNAWLGDYFAKHSRKIHLLPTAVDARFWRPALSKARSGRRFIGWIGTASNLPYLEAIEGALAIVLKALTDVDLLVVSNEAPTFANLPHHRVIYKPWSESTEIADIQSMSLGLMPLTDSLWARGKCSFKMLQYMACGVPAVVSPVGMNSEVAAMGGAVTAGSESEWVDALVALLSNERLHGALSVQARSTVVEHYSTELIATRLGDILRAYR
jgi:glycosyltransferase involved in cell wall biosynthesis